MHSDHVFYICLQFVLDFAVYVQKVYERLAEYLVSVEV